MRSVRFTSSSGSNWPWKRQFPGREPVWERSAYCLDTVPQLEPKTEWLVVYDGFCADYLDTTVPIERRVFVAGEPESFYRYQTAFLRQFGTVISPQSGTDHPHVILSQPAVNWFAGVQFQKPGEPGLQKLAFADFLQEPPTKTRLCSVICSDKTDTAGHRQRKDFVDRLMVELGDKIDFYGRGRNPMDDKDTALAEYRFHIAIENSCSPHYWTEKLADPYLRGCFPIYSGCTNADDYFPTSSFVSINLEQPEEAIATITAVLKSKLDTEQQPALSEARRRILYEHNIFALLERSYKDIEAIYPSTPDHTLRCTLWSDSRFKKDMRPVRRFLKYIRSVFCPR
jgi:hypothetical protein